MSHNNPLNYLLKYAKQLNLDISGQKCLLLLKICIYSSQMIVKTAWSKPELLFGCAVTNFWHFCALGWGAASQTGLLGSGVERGRPVYREIKWGWKVKADSTHPCFPVEFSKTFQKYLDVPFNGTAIMIELPWPNESWVRIPGKARRGICEQDTLKSTARGSQNLSRIACGTYP
jgi:hypothetical protein